MHEIRSWRDLKNRLDSDRRCYAFFHPRMPGEPLIFVEVALVKGLAGSVQGLLDEKAPVQDPREADTAIFYSISNCQRGLAGISFGNFLIKRVVEELSARVPQPEDLRHAVADPGLSRAGSTRSWRRMSRGLLIGGGVRQPALGDAGADGASRRWLRSWPSAAGGASQRLRKTAEPVLVRLCARYLLAEAANGKRGARSGGAFPPVERRAGGTDQHAGRHVGEGRQGERHADGQLPLRSGEDRGLARGLCRRGQAQRLDDGAAAGAGMELSRTVSVVRRRH